MRGKQYKAEEIIPKRPEAEVLMSQGMTQDLAAKQIGVSTQTRIRWRKEYGGLRMDQAMRAYLVIRQTFHVQLHRLAYPDGTNREAGAHSVWPGAGPAPAAGGAAGGYFLRSAVSSWARCRHSAAESRPPVAVTGAGLRQILRALAGKVLFSPEYAYSVRVPPPLLNLPLVFRGVKRFRPILKSSQKA